MNKIYKTFYCSILFFLATASLKSQCSFTTAVPYLETFAGITNNNQLPPCWAASNMSVTCFTYTSPQTGNRSACSGNSFASFSNTLGAHYFYTKGIQLNAGVNYSTSIWFKTEYYGYTNWTDLSILYGTTQNSTALTSIVSTNSAAVAGNCKSLSGTFSVTTSGIYYLAIRATSNGSAGASYLSWDDFLIEAPCQLNGPTFLLNASSTVICAGKCATLTTSGATTYTWNNNGNLVTSSVLVVCPPSSNTYSVIGNNSVTSCIATKSVFIQVNPSPIVSILASSGSVCFGNSITLNGVGALTYSWSNGAVGNGTQVAPLVNTSYSVNGFNQYGCSGTAIQQINVNPLPTISIVPSSTFICKNDAVTLTAMGAVNYQWTAVLDNWGATVILQARYDQVGYFTLFGTDNNGCTNSIPAMFTVNECLGLKENNHQANVLLFPNPVTNILEIAGLNAKSFIEIVDISGRLIFATKVNEEKTKFDLLNFTKGIYFFKIKSGNEVVIKKIIKE